MTNYKITLKSEKKTERELQEVQFNLDFIFKIICGCGFPIAKFKTDTTFNNSTYCTNKKITSHREIDMINKKDIRRIKKIICVLNSSEIDRDKVNLLKSIIDIAMSQVPNSGMSGAFYIVILESLFVPEKDSEIGYRFSMRLSKIRRGDSSYKKQIKDCYNKRSIIFHSGKDKFKKNDLNFIEEEACWAIEKYLIQPDIFSNNCEKIDELLIK
ncbi:MAG: hypothetical protein P1P85_00835 [Patescibacteria group bacterium]|nr:hypothetical protein [Patescibacteria group bacterium]